MADRRLVITMITLVVILPLCFPRELGALAWVSMAAVSPFHLLFSSRCKVHCSEADMMLLGCRGFAGHSSIVSAMEAQIELAWRFCTFTSQEIHAGAQNSCTVMVQIVLSVRQTEFVGCSHDGWLPSLAMMKCRNALFLHHCSSNNKSALISVLPRCKLCWCEARQGLQPIQASPA